MWLSIRVYTAAFQSAGVMAVELVKGYSSPSRPYRFI